MISYPLQNRFETVCSQISISGIAFGVAAHASGSSSSVLHFCPILTKNWKVAEDGQELRPKRVG